MTDRLISADALLKDINDYPYGYRGMIKDTIARQPTVEPKHGYWVREPNCWYRCSECGSHYPSIADNMNYHYCPNCGAKMDERREDGKID